MRTNPRLGGWLIISMALMLALTMQIVSAAESLTGAGATFPYPLYSKWISVYGKETGTQINYQAIGSGGGIKQLAAGTVDFGASDAPLSNDEAKTMPGRTLHIPTVAGAVAVVYNVPGVDTGLKLTPDVLARIFLGTIRRWNDPAITALNPSEQLPSTPIAVVHRSDGSGTTYIFTSYLKAVNRAWATRVGAGKSVDWPTGIGGKGNDGVAGVVMKRLGTIGYVELAYATQNKLPYAQIRNRAGRFVEPTLASTTAAAAGFVAAMKKDVRVSIVNAPGEKAYPISGFTYLLVYRSQRDKAKGAELVRFIDWAIHEGQKYAAPLHYAPLPEEIVTLNEAALKSVK